MEREWRPTRPASSRAAPRYNRELLRFLASPGVPKYRGMNSKGDTLALKRFQW